MKTFYNVVNSIICCAKDVRVLIVLNDSEWVQFVFFEIVTETELHCVRGLYDKTSAS